MENLTSNYLMTVLYMDIVTSIAILSIK